jgi:hypothetical protein
MPDGAWSHGAEVMSVCGGWPCASFVVLRSKVVGGTGWSGSCLGGAVGQPQGRGASLAVESVTRVVRVLIKQSIGWRGSSADVAVGVIDGDELNGKKQNKNISRWHIRLFEKYCLQISRWGSRMPLHACCPLGFRSYVLDCSHAGGVGPSPTPGAIDLLSI